MKRSKGQQLDRWLDQVGARSAFEALSDACADAIVFAVDADRTILHWNRGAERLLGFRAEEVLGEHCLKANRCEKCMVGCGIAEHGDLHDVPLVLYRSDGMPLRLRKSAHAFFDAGGNFAGGVEVLAVDQRPPEIASSSASMVTFHRMASADPAMLRVFDTCKNVAETDAPVLVRGDSGVGKELLARAIHEESARKEGPFVALNCAALPSTLAESELFGHVKGAFTGAVKDRDGIFRQAHGGTLFLDEVAELPLDLQSKLLRVLEDKMVAPVGGTKSFPVDVRLVAATHESLRKLVSSGKFREDLMFRLRVVPIFIPPLRERRRDITGLLWRFIGERNRVGPRMVDRIAPSAMQALLDYEWPGNVREMKNVVEYAFAVGRGPEIGLSELPPELREKAQLPTTPEEGAGGERARIQRALEQTEGHVGKAAELLGISRPTLWRRRKKYGI